jgi:hypothetical protein
VKLVYHHVGNETMMLQFVLQVVEPTVDVFDTNLAGVHGKLMRSRLESLAHDVKNVKAKTLWRDSPAANAVKGAPFLMEEPVTDSIRRSRTTWRRPSSRATRGNSPSAQRRRTISMVIV